MVSLEGRERKPASPRDGQGGFEKQQSKAYSSRAGGIVEASGKVVVGSRYVP